MISLDPFYLLLLMEALLIQTGLMVFFYLRGKRGPTCQGRSAAIKKDIEGTPEIQGKEEPLSLMDTTNALQGDFTFLTDEATEEKGTEDSSERGDPESEIKRLEQTVEEKLEIILQLKNKVEEMGKKYEAMENEYQILFDQSQKQEEALKAYGVGKNTDLMDF
jgi:hypothetical protein